MQQQIPAPNTEQEIDLVELAQKIWKEREFIFKACAVGAVVGLVVAFSIPKEYVTKVKLSPEMNGAAKAGGDLGGLAAMAGISMGGGGGTDALSVELYPDIVKSTPFLLDLIDVKVTTQDGAFSDSLYVYMQEEQKSVWWSSVIGAPMRVLGWGFSLFKETKEGDESDPWLNAFVLSKDQEEYVFSLSERISVTTDKKSGVITGSVKMQDPLISAALMEVVLENLQKHITDYRTRKAKHDLIFTEKLFGESKANYFAVQKEYAHYMDANKNIVSASFRTEEERLQNEMDLTYGVYTQMAQQLEQKKIKVQEQTPVYTVIEPARVPLSADSPKKPIILIGFVFMAGFLSVLWVLVRKLFLNQIFK